MMMAVQSAGKSEAEFGDKARIFGRQDFRLTADGQAAARTRSGQRPEGLFRAGRGRSGF